MGPGDYSGRNRIPPPRPRSNDERLATLEANENHYREDVEAIGRQLEMIEEKMGGKLGELGEAVMKLSATTAEIAKSRAWWSKVYAGVATAGLVTLIGFLIKIALVVQGARLPTP